MNLQITKIKKKNKELRRVLAPYRHSDESYEEYRERRTSSSKTLKKIRSTGRNTSSYFGRSLDHPASTDSNKRSYKNSKGGTKIHKIQIAPYYSATEINKMSVKELSKININRVKTIFHG